MSIFHKKSLSLPLSLSPPLYLQSLWAQRKNSLWISSKFVEYFQREILVILSSPLRLASFVQFKAKKRSETWFTRRSGHRRDFRAKKSALPKNHVRFSKRALALLATPRLDLGTLSSTLNTGGYPESSKIYDHIVSRTSYLVGYRTQDVGYIRDREKSEKGKNRS